MQGKMDRDEWYSLVFGSLKEIFLDDAPPTEEMARRKNLYGDPRVSTTIIRDYLSRFVGVISFSSDPLIPTMWAHYARNSGFVVGYNTGAMSARGIDLRRVLYLELAPVYYPARDNIVRLQFVDEERRKERTQTGGSNSGIPLMSRRCGLLRATEGLEGVGKGAVCEGRNLGGREGNQAAGRFTGARAHFARKMRADTRCMSLMSLPK